MLIDLSFEEGLAATVQGATQMMRAVQQGLVGRDHGGVSGRDLRERWAQAIHGQLCEAAFCKALDIFPCASRAGITLGDPGGWAIRGTPWATGHLIVNAAEQPAHGGTPYVLVCGHWPRFRIAGMIYGRDATRPDWWRADESPPSWWVPQHALTPVVGRPEHLFA